QTGLGGSRWQNSQGITRYRKPQAYPRSSQTTASILEWALNQRGLSLQASPNINAANSLKPRNWQIALQRSSTSLKPCHVRPTTAMRITQTGAARTPRDTRSVTLSCLTLRTSMPADPWPSWHHDGKDRSRLP